MTTDEAIKQRRTRKLRADISQPLPVKTDEKFRRLMEEIISLAGRAPFHHQSEARHRTQLDGPEPWRFYALDTAACRTLLENYKQQNPCKCSEGTMQMLAAADGLILSYWLPEKNPDTARKFYPNITNQEHIAATAAAIQNMLLAATARGINIYWSSGGCLRKDKTQAFLGIPEEEILLGAVFLFPDDYSVTTEVKPGKNHDIRTSPEHWMRWLGL